MHYRSMHLNKLIGGLIRSYRKDKKLTQSQLADRMEVDFQVISNYENGRRMPSVEWLLKCCDALEISPGEFMSELDKKRK